MVRMIELRIKITRENAEKIAQLIKELVQLEGEGLIVTGAEVAGAQEERWSRAEGLAFTKPLPDYLSPPPELAGLKSGHPYLETSAAKHVGTWGQFNSFTPIKAVLRILCHTVSEKGGEAVNLQELVDRSREIFKTAGLARYRGFPSSNKDSAVGRLVWHFITPAHEMGLVRIEGAKEIPARGWGKVMISPTKEGLEFAGLKNHIFDERGTKQVLSDAEREWMLGHLKKMDAEGYKEYSFLLEVFGELKKGNTDIASWLENNRRFINYVKSWSRKAGEEKKLKKQLANVATMFAQSKIALLRELGVISDKRNDYTVIDKQFAEPSVSGR